MNRRRIRDYFIITARYPYTPYEPMLDRFIYITGLIGLVIIFSVIIIDTVSGIDILSLIPPCALYSLTGYYCPGCGGTRALICLLQGKIITSFLYHPIVPYAGLPGMWLIISHTLYYIQIKIKSPVITRPLTIKPIFIYIGIVILLLQCIVKNAMLLFFDFRII